MAYAGVGAVLGFVQPELGAALVARGFARGSAAMVALTVNLVLPASALATTVWYPRKWTAALAGPMTYGGYALGELMRQTPAFWRWTPATLLPLTHPVLVVGSVVLSVLAVAAAWSVSAWRRVAEPPDPSACRGCGYHRGELAVCPECGADGM